MRKLGASLLAVLALALIAAACGEREVIREVPVEKVVTQEVVKEVPVEVVVEREVVKTVEVPVEKVVTQEVIKEVMVPGETVVVTQEVIKEVPVEVVVEKEVIKEVMVPGETVFVTKEVIKEIEVEKPIVTFGEAPTLAQLVQAGRLPPVEERLPERAMVIPVVNEIGKYGGTIRRAFSGARDSAGYTRLSRTGFMRPTSDASGVLPAAAMGMEASPDLKTWTINLRTGMRWSDGAPFTADDVVYQYNAVMLNEELSPAPPSRLVVNGELAVISKVDDYTVQVAFAGPNGLFPVYASQMDSFSGTNRLYAPAHWLGQFNLMTNSKANELAKEQEFDTWVELYQEREDYPRNPDTPSVRPWHLTTSVNSQRLIAERNPYFYAVDNAGNQLPYIDRIVYDLIEDGEVIQLKMIAGELDFQGRHLRPTSLPLLKDPGNMEKGNYHIQDWQGLSGSTLALFYNLSCQSPTCDVLREKDFRIALSHAVDRQAIVDIVFLGRGRPQNPVPPASHPYYPGDDYAMKYIGYDPDLANSLLDGVVPNKDGDGFRLLPNGERILLTITALGWGSDASELIGQDWEAVGIKTKVDEVPRSLLATRLAANESMMTMWGVGTLPYIFSAPNQVAPFNHRHQANSYPGYALWFETEGKEGIEPPQVFKDQYDRVLRGRAVGDAERAEIGKEIYRTIIDEIFYLNVAGGSPASFVVSNRLGNVPEIAAMGWPVRSPATAFPEQFFYRE